MSEAQMTMSTNAATATYLPGGVAEALRKLAVPASVMEQVAPTGSPLDVVPRELSETALAVLATARADRRVGEERPAEWAAEELALVEATEKVKAWADFQQLAALRRLREALFEGVREHNDAMAMVGGQEMPPSVVEVEADTASVDEVMLATGLPQAVVARRLELGQDEDGRGQVLLSALAKGDVSLDRAVRIHQAIKGIGVEQAIAVSARLVVPKSDGTVRSHQWLARELRRQVTLHTPDPAAARADAIERRCAYAVLDANQADGTGAGVGTGTLVVTGESGRVTAAIERVDDLARRLRAAGDTRTLAQLRSDIALDLVLLGWSNPSALPDTAQATFAGTAPAAHVNVVVSLATLLGWEHGVAEIPGCGFITGDHARQLACAAGSVWRRLVTDPVTGAAVELSTRRYRPTRAMADQLAGFDGVCRWPGCTVPAHRCDIDRDRPWPTGETSVRNMSHKHRRHHNHKTRGTATTLRTDDGAIVWRTASGRRYRTALRDYHDPLGRPVSETEIERAVAHDPPPF